MKEKDLEANCRTVVRAFGGRFIKLTGVRGIPDRLVLLPKGKMIFVEFKRSETARNQPLQQEWQSWLLNNGYPAYRISSSDVLVKILTEATDNA